MRMPDTSAMELQWYGRYSARVRDNLQRGKSEPGHNPHVPRFPSAVQMPTRLVTEPVEPREATVLPPYTPMGHETPLPPYDAYKPGERR